MILQGLYNTGIRIMIECIGLVGLFNNKAKLWSRGRKNWKLRLKESFEENKDPILWFHVSSLGEFEQGRELITACRQQYPEKKILLTFFSPSGYEICKNTTVADYVFYIPADIPRYADRFLDIVKPQAAIFIKYEYWFNFMQVMHKRRIPLYFVAARFRKENYFFKPWAKWFRNHLKGVSGFFVQDNDSKECLNSIGINNVWVAGDTRMDRVMRLLKEDVSFPIVEKFINKKQVIVAGSVWDEDMALIRDCEASKVNDFKWIIVPHEIKKSRISNIQRDAQVEGCVLYSQARFMNESQYKILENSRIMIIDEVGMLSKLYRYADITYIGGGFGKGIHNTLEAAVYGKPVIFGPKYQSFSEAVELIKIGAGFSVNDVLELGNIIKKLLDEDVLKHSGQAAANYVKEHAGAVDLVMKQLSSQW